MNVERLYKTSEVAAMARLSPRTIRNECQFGHLRSVRVAARSIRIPESAIAEWIGTDILEPKAEA